MYDDDQAHSSSLSRRDFIKRGGAGLLGAAAALGAPAIHAAAPTEIVFSFGPDDSGTLRSLIDAFNRQHEGDIHVTWREMPGISDAYFRRLQSDFIAGAGNVDVIGGDVVWTAEFARNGWIRDLSNRFHDTYNADDFLRAALDSASYQFRTWAVPWYTDVGMLYYRRDLLQQHGFDAPPTTWDELQTMAQQITQDSMTQHGFVFQGDVYEGGVTNACEYIWNAGGRVMTSRSSIASVPGGHTVMDPNVVTVKSASTAQGLDTARRLITSGAAPAAVTAFREQEAQSAFLSGNAVFMRNWPYVYGIADDPEQSTLNPEQIGVAPLPTEAGRSRSFSCLGGWNLMLNASTSRRKRDAAWTFIQFLTDPQHQKDRALGGGFLPSLQALYDDPEIQGANPVIALGKTAIDNARPRPMSPFYSQISPRIALAFNRTLSGEVDGEEAASILQDELENILRRNR